MTTVNTNTLQMHFCELAGQLAEMCAFNRSLGQIYGILYLSPEPLSLEDIAKSCRMSKGNASVHLRTLQRWEAVHRTWKSGNRKDYYAANTDLRRLALKRLQEGVTRRVELARIKFSVIKEDPEFLKYVEQAEGTFAKDRMDQIESLLDQVENGAAMLPKLLVLKSLF